MSSGLQRMIPRTAMANALEQGRDEARIVLLETDGGRAVLDNIRGMASKPMRNAHWASLFAEIVGWTGTKQAVLNMLVMQLGVPLDDAKSAVETVMRAPKDPHDIARTCREYLTWYDSADGPGADAV